MMKHMSKWTELKTIIVSEIPQTQKDKYYSLLDMDNRFDPLDTCV